MFGEHQKSKESEVDNVNPGHHKTPVPAAGRVVFRGTEVGFSAALIANTAQHKPASPAQHAARAVFARKAAKTSKKQNKISDPQNFSFSRITARIRTKSALFLFFKLFFPVHSTTSALDLFSKRPTHTAISEVHV